MNGLLANLVAARETADGWSPERVATDALVYILNEPAARTAFATMADELVPGLDAAKLHYAGQVVSKDAKAKGRPDVVGSTRGEARVVIEAKFAAPLTVAQSEGAYLTHLAPKAGLLVYLVPEDRVDAMWSAARRIHVDAQPVEHEGPRRLATPEGHIVAILAWTKLLDQFASTLSGTAAEGDLAQLRGLVDWRSSTQWIPILRDDLSDRVGRQLAALSQMVLRAAKAALTVKTRAGTTDWGPGRYLTTPGGREFWVGVWYKAWSDEGHTPVWASVWPSSTVEDLRASLWALGRESFKEGKWVAIPLYLTAGDEEHEAEERLRNDIVAVADMLDSIGVGTIDEADD